MRNIIYFGVLSILFPCIVYSVGVRISIHKKSTETPQPYESYVTIIDDVHKTDSRTASHVEAIEKLFKMSNNHIPSLCAIEAPPAEYLPFHINLFNFNRFLCLNLLNDPFIPLPNLPYCPTSIQIELEHKPGTPWTNNLYTNQTLAYLFNSESRIASYFKTQDKCLNIYFHGPDTTSHMPYMLEQVIRNQNYPVFNADLRIALITMSDLIWLASSSPYFPSLRYALEQHKQELNNNPITVEQCVKLARKAYMDFKESLQHLTSLIHNSETKSTISSIIPLIPSQQDLLDFEQALANKSRQSLIDFILHQTTQLPFVQMDLTDFIDEIFYTSNLYPLIIGSSDHYFSWGVESPILEQIFYPQSSQHTMVNTGATHGDNIRTVLAREGYETLFDTHIRDIQGNTYHSFAQFAETRIYQSPYPTRTQQQQTKFNEIIYLQEEEFQNAHEKLLSELAIHQQ